MMAEATTVPSLPIGHGGDRAFLDRSRTPAVVGAGPAIVEHRAIADGNVDEVGVEAFAHLPAIVVRRPWESGLAVDVDAFEGLEVRGYAVLVATGWDRHWGTDAYYGEHSFVTAAAAEWLAGQGVALVGIDSHNIDDIRVRARPVHTILLRAGVPICEHMTNLGALPDDGFAFTAAPPKIEGMGTFPVRAFALLN